ARDVPRTGAGHRRPRSRRGPAARRGRGGVAGRARRGGARPRGRRVTGTVARPVVVATRAELDRALTGTRAADRAVALVPTMGARPPGHLALVERAAELAEVVVVSVFVNPLQFAPGEDLERYPRSLAADVEMAGTAGAHVVYAPGVDEMYPT